MAQPTVRVRGYKEFARACNKAERETKGEVRGVYKQVGEIVRREAAGRFAPIDAGSAAGFRVAVRTRGVSVEQRRKRTTGNRGDYGALQMRRALLPAMAEKENEVVEAFEDALDKVADILDG